MKRKQQFLRAIEILAPGDQFILKTAQSVPEESLPLAPGGAAVELVVALQKLKPEASRDFSPPNRREPERGGRENQLSMSHALRIQSAHYWLKLGEVDQALLELGALSTKACNHPLAVKARVAVLQTARKLKEVTVQE
jgi:hypothetical protein